MSSHSPSAAQIQWAEIAEGVRAGLAKLVGQIALLPVEDAKTLVETIDLAQALEVVTSTWDDFVAHRRRDLQAEKPAYEE